MNKLTDKEIRQAASELDCGQSLTPAWTEFDIERGMRWMQEELERRNPEPKIEITPGAKHRITTGAKWFPDGSWRGGEILSYIEVDDRVVYKSKERDLDYEIALLKIATILDNDNQKP